MSTEVATASFTLPFGTADFMAYWAAFHAFADGKNPYDGATLLAYQQSVLPMMQEPQMYLNPPFALILLAPVLALPFEIARIVWIVVNVLGWALGSYLACTLIKQPKTPLRYLLVSCALFIPPLANLRVGQLSMVSTLFFLLMAKSLRNKRDILAGVWLTFVLLKPQFVFLVLALLGLSLIRLRRVAPLVVAGVAVTALSCTLELVRPGISTAWLASTSYPLQWRTSTLATPIRTAVLRMTGELPSWPTMAVPALALIGTIVWYARRRDPEIEPTIPQLLPLSLLTAPYAWLFDYSLLLLSHVTLVEHALSPSTSRTHRMVLLALLIESQVAVLCAQMVSSSLEVMIFFPIVYLVSFLLLTRWQCAEKRA